MEIPFELLVWENKQGYADYNPQRFAFSKGVKKQWVSIQGDGKNEWFRPSKGQMEAIKKFESTVHWLVGINEGPRGKGEYRYGEYVIYCDQNDPSYYIGRPGGKKRKVLLLPEHPGARKGVITMSSQIAQKVGSLGYEF